MPRDYHAAKRDILQAMPGTQEELVRRSGWAFDTVARWVKRLRADNQSHVGDWLPPNGTGTFVRVHYAGPGPDVKCRLKPQTNAEIMRNYRNRWMVNVFHPPGKEGANSER